MQHADFCAGRAGYDALPKLRLDSKGALPCVVQAGCRALGGSAGRCSRPISALAEQTVHLDLQHHSGLLLPPNVVGNRRPTVGEARCWTSG